MSANHKYQTKEVLNKVLNTAEDGLKVDDIATIKADIALIKADIASIKATTDKLDACIDTSVDKLNVSSS
tara:strand:- start:470 stop:679 length:210 start_codon:yes stop_codon:yes gene_type:complete